ncbi:MAG: helix-turn-helix domain-containing protein [Comamonadaceae bacterium]|nr:helix-turn-helix domain-containing protein [Comamonadaceae bacterium]
MKPSPLLMVPFREVLHGQPDDCLHYESVAVRGTEMDWTIPAHRHEGLHQFQFLDRGEIAGTIDGCEFKASAPVMLLLAPGSVHGFTYSRDSSGHQVTVPTCTLSRLLGETRFVEKELSRSFVITKPLAADELGRLLKQIADEFAALDEGRVQALTGLATLVAIRYVRERGEQFESEQRAGARDTLVRRFEALVEKHFTQQKSLDFYATELAVTADHLSRACRRKNGVSALQALHDRVLLEARRLLAYTELSVVDVSRQLGYADPAYFSRFFRLSVGHTPTQYRNHVASGVSMGVEAKGSE